ncbi:MAG TPA: ribonuclease H-like domain-containing protein [Spirochaetia bacterium]|nr:ribonuclease H-like domain-containing protein [Spirochaetia bacterium]
MIPPLSEGEAERRRDRSALAERLRRLKELDGGSFGEFASDEGRAARKGAHPGAAAARVDNLGEILAGWARVAEHLWLRETVRPSPLRAHRPARFVTHGVADDSRLLFLDIETTGLSGGAGTFAFLVGLGRVQGEYLTVRQYFLSDYPGEPEMIAALSEAFGDESFVVSYNGKSFDLPILKTRFALNGRTLAPSGHIDLLYPARRLWKRSLESCSLHTIETEVLGKNRDDDVPGFLVPEIYFEFLRTGTHDRLESVFAHHLEDIASLAELLDYIEHLSGRTLPAGVDPVELGRMLLDRWPEAGLEILRSAAEKGEPRALRIYSDYLKRAKRFDEAAAFWEAAWKMSAGFYVGVELAKYYEHKARDMASALSVVNKLEAMTRAARLAPSLGANDLRRRRARLERKSQSQGR